jgi:methyl halide transferase
MSRTDWDSRYAADDTPWDTGRPASHLVEIVEAGTVGPGRALDIGCGTGTNALWLAAHGFDVVGVDVSLLAIERARSKAAGATRCRFEVLDFLTDDPPGGPFQFIFDRGCFHVFDEADVRTRFAARVAELLVPGGQWLSLIGSTEGPPRDVGPPRRSAREVMDAIEPALELLSLQSTEFDVEFEMRPMAWLCLSHRRNIAAQPSTQR